MIKAATGLKSTLPSREGTAQLDEVARMIKDLNPPFPHGKGRLCRYPTASKRHLNPPFPHGKGLRQDYLDIPVIDLNPPFPHGKGPYR